MPCEVVMPRLGWSGETGTLIEWVKLDGEAVTAGDVICTVEGEKATIEVEALDSGVLQIPADSPAPGTEVPVGTLMAYIMEASSALSSAASATGGIVQAVIVGPSMLMATGAAYTYTLQRSDRVSVAFFGDGGSNNGAFHEGLNLAAIWKLPVLFVCENNQYATEVPFATVAANANVADRGRANGVCSERLDGNDVVAISIATEAAVRRARAGDGPTLLERLTYRTRAHSEGMADTGYRTREEVESWRQRDPLQRARRTLVAADAALAADLAAIDAEVQAEVDGAYAEALNAPWPDPATVTALVYAESAGAA